MSVSGKGLELGQIEGEATQRLIDLRTGLTKVEMNGSARSGQ